MNPVAVTSAVSLACRRDPHWLSIATFADGATKVGTASDLRKRPRLVEQGAVSARYLAFADNGCIVRILEVEITRDLDLTRAVE